MSNVSMRRGVKWVATGSISNKAAEFLFGVILARLLVPADFGLVLTIQIFTGVLGIFSSAGMGRALVQAKTIQPNDYNVVFTVQLIVGCLIYAGFFIISPWFATWFGNPLYENLMRVSALLFFMRPFVNVGSVMLHRDMRFKERAIVGFTAMVGGNLLSVFMALHGAGPWSLIYGGLAGSCVNMLQLFRLTHWRPGFSLHRETLRRLAGYGYKATAIDMLEYFRTQTSNLIVTKTLGPASLGLFNKAYSLSLIPMQVIGASAHPPLFRALSSLQDNQPQARYLYYKTIQVVTLYTLPIYVCLGWMAHAFIGAVFGKQWVPAAALLQLLVLAAPLRCVANPSGAAVEALNRIGQEVRISFESWVLLIILVLAGLAWQLEGVALAILASFAYYAIRMYGVAQSCVGGSIADLFRSIRAGLVLNMLLLLALLLFDSVIARAVGSLNDFSYVVLVTAYALSICAAAFALLPFPELDTERQRFSDMLRTFSSRIRQ